MKKKIFKRMTAVILAVISVFTIFPATSIAASAAVINDTNTVNLDKYGDVITNEELGELYSYGGYITKEDYSKILNARNSVSAVSANSTIYYPTFTVCTDTSGKAITVKKAMAGQYVGETALMIKINGSRAYCIQPGAPLYTSSGMNVSSDAYTALSDDKKEAINVALCFGWEGNSSAIKSGTTINEYQGYTATQIIIWEIVKGERSATAPYALKSGKSGYLSMYCSGNANGNIKTAYNRIVSAMSNYKNVPSFTSKSSSSAPTYTLTAVHNIQTNTWTYSSMTLNDANKVLSNYKSLAGTYNVGNATVTVTISGNKLKMTCSNGSTTATGKTIPLKAEKTGIPNTQQGKLVAYGASSYQDIITGGDIDPPNAYMNISVNVDITGMIERDGRILKSVFTEAEWDDPIVGEGEGSLSTDENVKGWYFYVEASADFKKYYGTDHFILGPTDSAGFTQTLSDYIKKNIDPGLSKGVPSGVYNFYELGLLAEGSSGNNLTDYYIPENYSTEGSYGSDYPMSSIHFDSSNNNSLSVIGYASNIYKIPFRLQKITEDGSETRQYYFTATNKATGDVYTLCTSKAGYAYVSSDNSLSKNIGDGVYNIYLPEGTYTIKELGKKQADGTYAIPGQYDEPMDIEIEISDETFKAAQESGYDAIQVDFTNTTSSYIAVEKSDSENASKLAGAVYGIYSDENCGNLLEAITTDSNGYARSADKYGTGTYYLQEITPPPGYELSTKIHTVEVIPTSETNNVVKIECTDVPSKGYVAIHKSDTLTGNSVSGATYGLYNNSAVDDNGNLIVSNKVASDVTTDNNGNATFAEAVKVGTYYVQEITPPPGYVRNKNVYKVTVTSVNTTVSTAVLAEVTNTPTKIEISKTDITGNAELPGAKLKVTDSANNVIDNWISGSTPHIIYGLIAGETYTLTEEIAPDGYITVSSINFTVNSDGTTTKVLMKDDTTKIEFNKVDDNNNMIAGSNLQILDSSNNVIDEWVTDGKTNHKIVGKLIVGKNYTLHEVSAPTGYNIASDKTFTVQNTAEVQTIKMVDKVIKGNVILCKQDDKGNALSGSQWALYNSDGTLVPLAQSGIGGYTYTTSGKVTTLDTGSDGKLTVGNLPYGSYYFKELKAPNGYVLSVKKYYFTISTTQTVTVTAKNTMKKGSVTLYKQNSNGTPIAGSQWELYTSDGDIVTLAQSGVGGYTYNTSGKVTTLDTGSDGKLTVSSLPVGDYYFVEVKSPNGTSTYGKKIEFTISADNETTLYSEVTVKDDKIIMYDTGGFGVDTIYFIGFTMLAISIAVVTIKVRKKHGK